MHNDELTFAGEEYGERSGEGAELLRNKPAQFLDADEGPGLLEERGGLQPARSGVASQAYVGAESS